jgi:hypothetical protein
MSAGRSRMLLAVAMLCALGACHPRTHEFCDEYCGCENCSDRDYELCLLDEQEQIDTASAYDCGDQRDAVDDCIIAKYQCKDSHFIYPKGADCGKQYDALTQCIDRGSDARD